MNKLNRYRLHLLIAPIVTATTIFFHGGVLAEDCVEECHSWYCDSWSTCHQIDYWHGCGSLCFITDCCGYEAGEVLDCGILSLDEWGNCYPDECNCGWICNYDSAWACDLDGDCDGDGWDNGYECWIGTDQCDEGDAPGCAELCANDVGAVCNLDGDCDGDGWDNGYECWIGTDQCEPDSFPTCVELCENDAGAVCNLEGDCDGDGSDNGYECWIGTDQCESDSFPTCVELCENDAGAVCDFDGDCDGDGWDNAYECWIGTDQCESDSFPDCNELCEHDIGAVCDLDGDCDGDGWDNGYECWIGTDQCDEGDAPGCDELCENDAGAVCDLDGDCDGDGWDNGYECAIGSDPCDPDSVPSTGCSDDSDCTADTPFCIDGVCVECRFSGDCEYGYACLNGFCEKEETINDATPGLEDQPADSSEDPVSVSTGAYKLLEVDLKIEGRMPILIQRYYNSKKPLTGPLGAYWRFSYNPYLYIDEPEPGLIKAADTTGRVMLYRESGDSAIYYAQAEYNPGIVNNTTEGIGGRSNPFAQSIQYDGIGNTFILTSGNQLKRYYEPNPLNIDNNSYCLSYIEDAPGNWIFFTYQSDPERSGYGCIETISNSSGNSVILSYNAQNRISSISSGDGRSVSYTYDAIGNLISFTNPDGYITRYEYEHRHLLTRVKKQGNRILENIYEAVDENDVRVAEQKSTMGSDTTPVVYNTFSYNLDARITTITDALGRSTQYYYDTLNRVTKIEDHEGNSLEYHYNDEGNLVEKIDKNGVVTSMEYDVNGNILVKTEAVGTPKQNVTTYTYDTGSNKIASMMDCRGGKIVYEYDNYGNLAAKKRYYRDGVLYEETRYELNEYGEPSQETVACGTTDSATTTFIYNNIGKIETKINAENETISHEYDERGNITEVRNGENETTTYDYDLMNRNILISNPLGEETHRKYDAHGNKISEIDPLGRETLYAYDYSDRLREVTLPLPTQCLVRYEYDLAGNRTKMIDALGRETDYTYDSLNRLFYVEGPACCGQSAAWARYSYDANGNRRAVETPSGVTHYYYDAMNRLITVEDDRGYIKTIEYDCLGQKTKKTDRNGNYTAYEYDDFGRLTRMEYRDTDDVLLSCNAFGYDRRNNVIMQTDGRGHITTLNYDKANRLVRSIDPYGKETSYIYDKAGRLKERTDTNGNRDFLITYDDAGRAVAVEDALGKTVEYGYDAVGNTILYKDQAGNETMYDHDELNRLIKITDASGYETIHEYNAMHLVKEIDANGNETRYEHNDFDEVSKKTDPLWNITSYEYAQSGNRTKIIDPLNHEINFVHDSLNRLVLKTDQMGNDTSFEYDPVGNLIRKVDPNGTEIVFTYDGLNRLISRSDTGATFTYDPNNNITEMSDPSGTTSYSYDDNDRLVLVASPRGMIRYAYDNVGNTTSMTYPDGRTLTYYYRDDDTLERIEVSAGGAIGYLYDNANNLACVTYPNGTKKEILYNELHQMTSLVHKRDDETLIKGYSFEYDALGNKTRIVESDSSGTVATGYSYDALSMLITEDRDGQQTNYSYDPLGNRISKNEGEFSTGYQYNELNQLIALGTSIPELRMPITVLGTVEYAEAVTVNGLVADRNGTEYSREIELAGGKNIIEVSATSPVGKQAHRSADVFLAENSVNFEYDNNGNMTRKIDANGTTAYTYDVANRLIAIAYPDERPAASYTYNGKNKKVNQNIGGEVTQYLWDGDQIIRELDGNGRVKATLIHGPGLGADIGSLVKAERAGQEYFFHHSWRGDVVTLTNQTAQTVHTYNYDAFGNITDSTGAAVNPYRFSGKSFDPNSGLSYFGRRHYSASLGRFITRDPEEYLDGLNTYAYVKNNPVNLIDFVGLSSNCKELLEELESLDNKLNNLIADLLDAEDEYRDMTDCLGAIPECVPWFTLKEWFDTAEAIRQIKKDIPGIRSECEKIKNDYEASCELVVSFHNYCAQ